MSLEERWGLVEFENLKGAPWQLGKPRPVVARQPVLSGGERVNDFRSFWKLVENRPKLKSYVLRGDVERLVATDGMCCVYQSHLG